MYFPGRCLFCHESKYLKFGWTLCESFQIQSKQRKEHHGHVSCFKRLKHSIVFYKKILISNLSTSYHNSSLVAILIQVQVVFAKCQVFCNWNYPPQMALGSPDLNIGFHQSLSAWSEGPNIQPQWMFIYQGVYQSMMYELTTRVFFFRCNPWCIKWKVSFSRL